MEYEYAFNLVGQIVVAVFLSYIGIVALRIIYHFCKILKEMNDGY